MPGATRVGAGVAVGLALMAAPLGAQSQRTPAGVWRMEGLRGAFCILFLVDPKVASRSLPAGLELVSAGQADNLHPSLAAEVRARPDLGAWSPSHLCFYSLDTIQTADYVLRDKKGRKTQVLGLWTVSGSESGSGKKRDVALMFLTTNGRLIRTGKTVGQPLREMSAKLGKVPTVDENGVPNSDDRFQVKIGKTLVTWDGHPAADSSKVDGSVDIAWAASAATELAGKGSLTLTPQWASPMVGALKVEGKDDLAKALSASPVRFVGPRYHGGGGEIHLER